MTHFRIGGEFLRRTASVLITILAGAMVLGSCVDVDNTLGADFVPEEQKMRFATTKFNSLADGVEYFQTRLYKSDSVNTANLSSLYMGAMHSDTFGMRTAGFFVQHTPGNLLGDDIFGYKPLIDSATLFLTVGGYDGDTTYVQEYEVFAVTNNSFITESADSVFFQGFDIEQYIDDSEPLFTFTFPDQANGVYTSTSQVRLYETDSGREYLRALLFLDSDGDYTIDEDYDEDGVIDTADIREAYTYNDLWIERFKGLYVRPTSTPTNSGRVGAVYATDILYSGFGIYGRSLEETDPTIVKDSIGMTYMFYPVDEADEDDNADGIYYVGGELSINNITHDYSTSLAFDFDANVATESTDDIESIATVGTLYVEGMGGIVSQITLTKDLYLKLDTLLDEEYASSGEEFESIFFNQAMIKIYLIKESGVEEDYLNINPILFTEWLNISPTRLALYERYSSYTDDDGYSTLVGVSDYSYYYESLGLTLDFGGYLNRSWGCYTFNIPSHLQLSWNSFLEAKEAANDVVDDINWDDVLYRTFYLAPVSSSLYTLDHVALQGMTWDDDGNRVEYNNIPMEMSLTYTMID